MHVEGWRRATAVQAAILRDTSLCPSGKGLLLWMRTASSFDKTLGWPFQIVAVTDRIRGRHHTSMPPWKISGLGPTAESATRNHVGAGAIPAPPPASVGPVGAKQPAPKNSFHPPVQTDHPCPALRRKISIFRFFRICD